LIRCEGYRSKDKEAGSVSRSGTINILVSSIHLKKWVPCFLESLSRLLRDAPYQRTMCRCNCV
jgi:hypothetical protein